AERNKEKDQQFHELVEVRNRADALLHATEKSMKELGDKIEAAEKESIENAIKALKEALKTDDKQAIESKLETLTQASNKMAERVYAQKASQEKPQEAPEQPQEEGSEGGKGKGDDVVDAEFEEVKDDDK